jgi:hypothetical protein
MIETSEAIIDVLKDNTKVLSNFKGQTVLLNVHCSYKGTYPLNCLLERSHVLTLILNTIWPSLTMRHKCNRKNTWFTNSDQITMQSS